MGPDNFRVMPASVEQLDNFLDDAFHFVTERSAAWDLTQETDLETSNHAFRVFVQSGRLSQYPWLAHRLASCQHDDGGWGLSRDDPNSHSRSSAFSCQMLLRARRELGEEPPWLMQAISRGIDFILSGQCNDGSWRDRYCHHLDATSVSVGTLLFATHESGSRPVQRAALDAGMRYILEQRHDDGLWYHKVGGSPVEITAHFLQKCVPYGTAADVVRSAMLGLMKAQSLAGFWDQEDIDATCDATRCLMLAADSSQGQTLRPKVTEVSWRAVSWLLDLARKRGGGLGVCPDAIPNVLYTCDGIDTVLKYRAFQTGDAGLLPCYC